MIKNDELACCKLVGNTQKLNDDDDGILRMKSRASEVGFGTLVCYLKDEAF